MSRLFLVLCAFVCFSAASDVLDLGDADFASSIQSHPSILVEFFAPWCGHCKALAPEWEKAATLLKGKATVAKVDCTVEQNVCSGEGIQGYPTIKFFRNGQPFPYNGERTAAAIESWVLKRSGDAFTTVDSKSALEEVTKTDGTVLGFFENKDSAVFKEFSALAQTIDDLNFHAVFDSSLSSDFKADQVQTRLGGRTSTFDGTDLKSWVLDHGFPLVDKLNQKAFERFVQNKKKYFVLLFAPQVEPKQSVAILEEVAGNYRQNLGFLWDLGEQYVQHAPKLGITGEKFPVIVAMNDKEKFFPMGEEKEFNADTIKAFFDDLLAGNVAVHFQSEPIPESDEGAVKVVVGKNFDQVVKQSTNDVFLEIYAPWCGHCKSLAPVWEQLAEQFDGKGLVVAKVDGTLNDIPVDVQGFPTLVFYKAGSKDAPISYDGARDLESLVAFVKEQSSANLKDEL